MNNLLDHTLDSLENLLVDFGEQSYRAEQIFDWLYLKNIFDPADMNNLPLSLRETLVNEFSAFCLKPVEIIRSIDNCGKILFKNDDVEIETVAIFADDGRTTFCLSTQAGCPIGCTFCATGQMGFKRNLKASEIVAQVLLTQKETRRPDNIVLMGMGEGLMNYDEVDKFIRIISEPKGYALSERRITLSTAGLIDELERFHDIHPKVELAISLNAADDATRKELMPSSKLASFTEIIKAIEQFDFDITLEYVLLRGINDSLRDAEKLANALANSRNVKVNLIRYNKTNGEFASPGMKDVQAFQRIIRKRNVRCFIRKSHGSDISAACGQLAGKSNLSANKDSGGFKQI